MKIDQLIDFRDNFNKVVLSYEKKNKKWALMFILSLIIGIILIIVPACIVGDNNGQPKPLYFFILVYLGLACEAFFLFSFSFYLYHRIVINRNKKYRDTISHELNFLVLKNKTESDKKFPFLN